MHYFFDPLINEHSDRIGSSELIHFKSLRILKDEQIAITSGKGFGFQARVTNPQTGEIVIGKKLTAGAKVAIHLVQSIAKGGRDEAALQSATEMGIASATALQAERSISRWDSKIEKNLKRWEQIAIAAIKQSQQLALPVIRHCESVSMLEPKGVALVLDPRAQMQIGEVTPSDVYTVVVGPEGGFSQAELDEMSSKGFIGVRLGDSVLRTSTAGAVAISCLQLTSGEYGKRLD